MTDFVARGSRAVLVLTIAVCSSFVLFGPSSDGTPPTIAAATWLLTAMAACAVIVSVARLFLPRDELRVGAQGVYWSRWSNTLIPWSAIERVAVRRIRYVDYVCVKLRDRESFPPHGVERVIAPFNRIIAPSFDITLSTLLFDRNGRDVIAAFERRSPPGVVFEARGCSPRI